MNRSFFAVPIRRSAILAGVMLAPVSLGILLLGGAPLDAQTPEESGTPAPGTLANRVDGFVIFNQDDAFLALSYRRAFGTKQIFFGPLVLAMARFWDHSVLEPLGPHLYLQQMESRFYLAAGGEAGLALGTRMELSARTGVGYSFGDFAGSAGSPEEGWVPFAGGRASLRLFGHRPRWFLCAGYLWVDLWSDHSNWADAGIGIAW
jgi:hypothetical protein